MPPLLPASPGITRYDPRELGSFVDTHFTALIALPQYQFGGSQ